MDETNKSLAHKRGKLNWTHATPEQAKKIWDSMERPNAQAVSEILRQAGVKISHVTILKWQASGWQIKTSQGVYMASLGKAKDKLDRAVPLVTGDASVRIAELSAFLDKLNKDSKELSEFEKALESIGREIVALDDDKLLVESHRSLLQLSVLGSRMMLIHTENFKNHPDKVGVMAKALAYCVDVVTTSLHSARMGKLMQEQNNKGAPRAVAQSRDPDGRETVYPPGEDPFDDILGPARRQVGM